MSTQRQSHPNSPYTRDNFWGDDPDTTDSESPSENGSTDPHDPRTDAGEGTAWGLHHHFKESRDVDGIIAHRLLRESATMLCAETLWGEPYNGGRVGELFAFLFDGECINGQASKLHLENKEVELTDPEFHIPKPGSETFGTREYGQHRHRARINTDTGYLTMGETTGVVIQDRPEQEFLQVVRDWLAGRGGNLRDAERERAVEYARRLKRGGDLRDTDILEKVVEKVRANEFDLSK